MSVNINELLQEIQRLSYEEKIFLYKALERQIATPLLAPIDFYDDWDEQAVDAAYEKEILG